MESTVEKSTKIGEGGGENKPGRWWLNYCWFTSESIARHVRIAGILHVAQWRSMDL